MFQNSINGGYGPGAYIAPGSTQTIYDQLLSQLNKQQSGTISGYAQNQAYQMGNDIIRVNGFEEARKFQMNGRNAIIMLDSEKPIMYFKYIVTDGSPPYYTNVIGYNITPIIMDEDNTINENNSVEEETHANSIDYEKIISELMEVKNTVNELSGIKDALGEITEMKEMLKSII